MEKLIYVLTGAEGDRLLDLIDRVAAVGATRIQVNLVDDDVAPANRHRITNHAPPPDAFVSLWLPTTHVDTRAPVDAAIRAASGGDTHIEAYLVTESRPLVDVGHASPPGTRTPGWAQMALLRRPAGQSTQAFLTAWLDDHTTVAIETQSTFSYTQHVVVRPLTVAGGVASDGPPDPIDGIVEECFPTEAMADPYVFFDAAGDEERFADHTARMVASTRRFLDFDRIDVIPTSRYVFG